MAFHLHGLLVPLVSGRACADTEYHDMAGGLWYSTVACRVTDKRRERQSQFPPLRLLLCLSSQSLDRAIWIQGSLPPQLLRHMLLSLEWSSPTNSEVCLTHFLGVSHPKLTPRLTISRAMRDTCSQAR